MPSYQKLQCRLSAPYILVACDGGLQRKKINTDDHLSMYSCSGGTELDKAAKFRISRSAWCTFSRGEQIRGYVHRENEHRGAHFRGWCTNSLANLCAGARLRGGERIRCYTGYRAVAGYRGLAGYRGQYIYDQTGTHHHQLSRPWKELRSTVQ